MLIENIKLKIGASPQSEPLVLEKPNCTVFVGPNNSGKSVVLREIAHACSDGRSGSNIIIDQVQFRPHTKEEAKTIFDAWRVDPAPGESLNSSNAFLKHGSWRTQLHIPHFMEALESPNSPDHRRHHYASYYASRFLLNLDGPSRINLVKPQDRGNLKDPVDSFARIFTDDARREKLRGALFEAFGLHLGIDMSESNNLVLRYGCNAPAT